MLREALIKKQRWDMDMPVEQLSEKMMQECTRNTPKLFRNLSTSTRKCLSQLDREKRYEEAKDFMDDVKRIVAILSLYSIKRKDAERLRRL